MKNRKFLTVMMMTLMVSAAAGCAEANTAAEPQEQTAQAGEDVGGNAPEETTGDSDAVKPEMRQEEKETEGAETEELKEAETEAETPEDGKPEGGETSLADGELSDDWTDMQFMLDGKLYELPTAYHELEADGWNFDLADYGYTDGYVMNPGDKTYNTIELSNPAYDEKLTVWVGFINTEDKIQDILDCDIWAFQMDTCVGSRQVENYPDMEIAKGIGFGSTREEVDAAFGACEDIYEADSGMNYVVYNYEVDYDKYLKLTIDGEKGVTAIDISSYE